MKLTCVVDNSVRTASSLWGEHGLAFMIETRDGKILFDTGHNGTVLLHNLVKLKQEPKDISAIVLSHGHCDHTGGLVSVLEAACGLPVIAHSNVFEERFAVRRKKAPRSIGIQFDSKKLSKWAELRLSKKAVEVLPGLWTTGTIYNRQFAEGRSPKHVVRRAGQYVPDPYLDDLSLVWKCEDGLVIILGCAHAGLLNILSQVGDMFAEPIRVVAGGMHLHGVDGARMSEVVGTLSADYPGIRLYPNHCTGMRGFLALHKVLGDMVEPCPAGTILEL